MDAGAIDGAPDLADVEELLIRGMPLSSIPPGAQLYVETSNPDALRLFACRWDTCSDVLLGPGLPPSAEIPIGDIDRLYGIEGVEDGVSLTLTLVLKTAEGDEICRDTVRVGVVKLEVKWETLAGEEIDEPNVHPFHPDPEMPIGVRYYPDATASGGAWNDVVKVRVETIPTAEGVIIYMKLLDPDDPAEDDNSLDVNDPNQHGGDNRPPQSGYALMQEITDNQGVVRRQIQVNHQPGDNHRVAATLKMSAWYTVDDDNIPPSGQAAGQKTDAQVSLFIGTISPLFTIWRRLWVEVDSMAAPDASNTQTGVIQGPPEHNAGNNHATLKIQNLAPDFEATDQHRVGRIDLSGYGSFVTIATEISSIFADQIEIINAPTTIVNAEGRPYTLWDDDSGSTGGFVMVGFDAPPVTLPKVPDTSLMEQVYAEAYIAIQDPDLQYYQNNTPFDRNINKSFPEVNGESRAAGNFNSDLLSSQSYWIVHITSALQGWHTKDIDPESEQASVGSQFGITIEDGGGITSGSLIYLETIRDDKRGNQQAMIELEQYTVVHESGHQFLLQHYDDRMPNALDVNPDDDFIMTDKTDDSGMAPNKTFGPRSRLKLRQADYPQKH